MTVAAVILAASPASALADADGTPAIRRLADVAWAGGATPVVVCSSDPDGAVARGAREHPGDARGAGTRRRWARWARSPAAATPRCAWSPRPTRRSSGRHASPGWTPRP